MSALISRLDGLGFWKISGLSFVLGLLLAATFAPLHLIFLLPVCYSGVLVLLTHAKTKKQAFAIGWWFGFGQFAAGFYWIGVAFTIDANAHAALIPIPTLILPAGLGIITGLVTLVLHIGRFEGLARIFAFAGFWVLAEYIRGILFTGFPWNLAGYSWGNNLAMLQITAYVGIYGLSALTVLISALPAILADPNISVKTRQRLILADCLILAILVGFGIWRLQTPPLTLIEGTDFRIVQPNNDQANKWRGQTRFEHVRNLLQLSEQNPNGSRVWIWPETAVPFFLTTDDAMRGFLQKRLSPDGLLITGAPRKDPKIRKYWNNVLGLTADGIVQGLYDKRHLVPYGEYLAMRSILEATGITSLIPALDSMSDFSFPDASMSKVTQYGNLPPARTLICYEVAYPWEVHAEPKFDWILNVTNDAWFGNTSGPLQHFVISRTRAIEQGVALIRSANSGVSAIVDGYGRVLAQRKPTDPGILDGKIPAPLKFRTVYGKYGEILPVSIMLFFLVLAFYLHWKSYRKTFSISQP
jgi:apolipoprotein N-acyltransferase